MSKTPEDVLVKEDRTYGEKFQAEVLQAVESRNLTLLQNKIAEMNRIRRTLAAKRFLTSSGAAELLEPFIAALAEAIKSGYIDVIDVLLNKELGIPIDTMIGYQRTALMIATSYGQVQVVAFLLKRGANPNVIDKHGWSALHYLFLHNNKLPEIASPIENQELITAFLLKNKTIPANPNIKSLGDNKTPIFWAIVYGSNKNVRFFLEAGAELNIYDDQGFSPISYAIEERKDHEILKLLLTKFDIHGQNVRGENEFDLVLLYPAKKALTQSHIDSLDILLNAGIQPSKKAVRHVLKKNWTAVIKLLLAHKKLDLDTPIIETDPPTPALGFVASLDHRESVEVMLTAKANVDIKNTHDETPLMLAAKFGNLEIVNMLLEAGAEINAVSHKGSTSLKAAAFGKHNAVVQRLLRDRTIDINYGEGQNQTTALGFSALSGDIDSLRQLLNASALLTPQFQGTELETSILDIIVKHDNIEMISLVFQSTQYKALKVEDRQAIQFHALNKYVFLYSDTRVIQLLSEGLDLNAKDKDAIPIIYAAKAGNISALKILISLKADVNASTNEGITALMTAAMNNQAETVQFLLTKGANIDAQSIEGATALMRACSLEDITTVKILLEAKASIELKDVEESTVVRRTVIEGNVEILRLLLTMRTFNAAAHNRENASLVEVAPNTATVKTLNEFGITGDAKSCQVWLYLSLFCFNNLKMVQRYIESVDVNQGIELQGVDLPTVRIEPLFLYANYNEKETKLLVLQHKLYKNFPEITSAKIDNWIENLGNVCTDFYFTEDGSLIITVARSGKNNCITLPSTEIEHFLNCQMKDLAEFREMLWEISPEGTAHRNEAELWAMEEQISTLFRTGLVQLDYTLQRIVQLSGIGNTRSGPLMAELIALKEKCLAYKTELNLKWVALGKFTLFKFATKEKLQALLKEHNEFSKTLQTEIANPLKILESKILGDGAEADSTPPAKKSKSAARREKRRAKIKFGDLGSLVAPKSEAAIENFTPPMTKPIETEPVSKTLLSSDKEALKLEGLEPNKSEEDTKVQDEIEATIQFLKEQQTALLPAKKPKFPKGVDSESLTTLLETHTVSGFSGKPRKGEFTFESATKLNARLKAIEGRDLLQSVVNSCKPKPTQIDILIDYTAIKGALAQAFENRKGLSEKWPNDVRNTIFRFEEFLDKLHSESEFLAIVTSISKKLSQITDEHLLKSGGRLPISEIDEKGLLETLSKQAIPKFSLPHSITIIQKTEQELKLFEEFILENRETALKNANLQIAIGFCLARIGTQLGDIQTQDKGKDTSLQKSRYSQYIPCIQSSREFQSFGREYRHNDPAWILGVQNFIEACLSKAKMQKQEKPKNPDFLPGFQRHVIPDSGIAGMVKKSGQVTAQSAKEPDKKTPAEPLRSSAASKPIVQGERVRFL